MEQYVQITNNGEIVATRSVESNMFTSSSGNLYGVMSTTPEVMAHGIAQLSSGIAIVAFPYTFSQEAKYGTIVVQTNPWNPHSSGLYFIGAIPIGFAVGELHGRKSNDLFIWSAFAQRK